MRERWSDEWISAATSSEEEEGCSVCQGKAVRCIGWSDLGGPLTWRVTVSRLFSAACCE